MIHTIPTWESLKEPPPCSTARSGVDESQRCANPRFFSGHQSLTLNILSCVICLSLRDRHRLNKLTSEVTTTYTASSPFPQYHTSLNSCVEPQAYILSLSLSNEGYCNWRPLESSTADAAPKYTTLHDTTIIRLKTLLR